MSDLVPTAGLDDLAGRIRVTGGEPPPAPSGEPAAGEGGPAKGKGRKKG
jgi:hypothetical protein